MKTIIVRKNKMFVINKSELSVEAKKDSNCNALYADIYTEFKGASQNPTYKGKTPKEMLDEVNKFANDWLQTKGLL